MSMTMALIHDFSLPPFLYLKLGCTFPTSSACCRLPPLDAGKFQLKRWARVVMSSTRQPVGITDKEANTSESSNAVIPSSPEHRVVVGCGIAGVDYLARVASFPVPDEKMRSTDLQVRGGGNAGNALTCAARLGLTARLFTKVANDGPGKQILDELRGDSVDTSNVVVFTYVIIDQPTGTRTCIHTPGYPSLEDVSPGVLQTLLSGANLVFLDGRYPKAALLLAKEATKRQIKILVDAERKMEGLDEILTFADYIVKSAKFPQAWTETSTLAEALLELLLRLPRARFIVVTLGPSGAIVGSYEVFGGKGRAAFYCQGVDGARDELLSVNDTLRRLMKAAKGCRDTAPHVMSSKVGKLYFGNESGDNKQIRGRLLFGTAVCIPSSELVDTTGAGDAFIGAMLYALSAEMVPEKMLPLGAVVAAANYRAMGARGGMPHRRDAKVSSFL